MIPPFTKSIRSVALLVSLSLGAAAAALQANIVINEIFYNAPNDLSDLEFVELLNTGAEPVDLSGWELGGGIKFVFPSGTMIEPAGFVVVCKDAKLFPRFHAEVKLAGAYNKSLANGLDKVRLENAGGELVDEVEYADEAPWPVSPDGYSASLERICPTVDDDTAANWAASVLSDDYDTKPSGTPGKQNSVFQASLPPLIEEVRSPVPEVASAGTAIEVTTKVTGADSVTLHYQVVKPGTAGEEIELPMPAGAEGRHAAVIPGQESGTIVRYRVRATGKDGAVRMFPAENEIRPSHSVYFSDPVVPGSIPVAQFFNVGEAEFKRGAEYRKSASEPRRGGPGFGPGGFGRGPETPENRARRNVERLLREDDLEAAWASLTLQGSLGGEALRTIRPPFREARKKLTDLREEFLAAGDAQAAVEAITAQLATVGDGLRTACAGALNEEQQKLLAGIGAPRRDERERREAGGSRGLGGGSMLQRFLNVEQCWFRVSMHQEIEEARLGEVREIVLGAIETRDGTTIEAGERGRPDFGAIGAVVEKQREALHKDLEKAVGRDLFAKLDLERGGSGFGGGGPREGTAGPPLLPQGRSALVYTDPASGQTRLFDFINIVPRKSGYKVRLHKDRMLDGMKTINVLFESEENTCINEPLAYDLYRAAGNVTQRAGYLRLVIDGALVGYHFWFEQANGSFLRHNKIHDEGNLYKVTWQGSAGASEYTPEDDRPTSRQDVVRRYDKISNPHDGYEDLIELVEAMEEAEGDDEAMWATIEKRFDVDNVINYFAANSLLSHWDGFFNNYYLYHDTKRQKWMMFPFDQDSTWSQRMGDVSSLSKMPLNYGSAEVVRGGFGRGGEMWWRDGGDLSKPLLANPRFKERFLARLGELTATVFNDEDFGTRIDRAEEALTVEVILRAKERGADEKRAEEDLRGIMDSLRTHLDARRAFVLKELENLQSDAEPDGAPRKE